MRPVLDKADFVRRYAAGEFGNAAPTWPKLEDCLASAARGPFHVRNRTAGGRTWYNVSRRKLAGVWQRAATEYGVDGLYISAMAPTPRTVIQGEVMEDVGGWQLTYSTVKLPMRDALQACTAYACGLAAMALVRQAMNERSWNWLRDLLERYPGHVVEFSVYDVCWGTVAGFNTVFWEVRNY